MKGELTLKILETIAGVVGGATELVSLLLSVNYRVTYGRTNSELARFHDERAIAEAERREAQRLQSMIYKLKKDGLIEVEKCADGKLARLTARGREKLKELRGRNKTRLPEPTYQCEPHARFTIVTFDIVERDRRKRAWLRDVLKHLTFTMLQKSVWVGKVKVPETLLADLKKLRLLDQVEIFEISKGGTLRQVT